MGRKLIPIKTIIKKIEKLAENPKANKKLLLKYSKLVEDQNKIVSRISLNKIKNKLNTNLSFEEYCKYKDLLEEKKRYSKYESTIENIINKNFKAIRLNRSLKRTRLTAAIATSVIILSVSSLGYVSLMKNRKNNKKDYSVTTEVTTENNTEATTTGYSFEQDNNDNDNNKELVYEKDDNYITNENSTEKETEATTESTTKATTEATTETTTKEEPTTTTIVFISQEKTENPFMEEENLIEERDEEIFINEVTTEEQVTETPTEVTTEEQVTEIPTEATTEEQVTEIPTEATTEEQVTEIPTEATTEEQVTETSTEATTQNIDTIVINDDNDYVEFDDDVIDFNKFEGLKNFYYKASEYINVMEDTLVDEDKRNDAKEQAKQKVVEYIDFIFYGKEIDGVTFNDLKDEEKQKTYEILQKLDNKISEDDPDYKERFGERYNRVKDFGSTTLDDAKNKIKEKVGEDYYNDAGTIKDDTIDSIKDTGKILKHIFDDMYQKWKNKDN